MYRKSLLAWTAVAALVIGAALLRNALGIEWNAESVRDVVKGLGVWAPAAFIALVTFRVLVLIPSQIMLPAAGLLFGATLGAVYGAIGMTLSALLSYGLVHVLGAEGLRRRFHHRFDAAFALASSRVAAGALTLATAYPVGPMSAFQLGAALAGMSLLHYFAAVAVGSALRSAALAYFGSTILDGERLLAGTAVLLAALLLPLLVPSWRAWLRAGLGLNPSEPRP